MAPGFLFVRPRHEAPMRGLAGMIDQHFGRPACVYQTGSHTVVVSNRGLL
jgi:hypothetical protein